VQIPRTLVVTNDYPPRIGGIQRSLEALVGRLPADRVAVLCPAWDGADDFDASAPYRVFRQPDRFLWPTPRVARGVHAVIEQFGAEVVLFGSTYPLALLGPGLAKRGTPYVTGAHGFEYWLSIAPGAHGLMRRATSHAARMVVMSSAFIARVVRTAVPDRVPVSVMYPGADIESFHPDVAFEGIRDAHALGDRRLVVCVSRLVRRKGQDVLIRAMAPIRERVPDAALLIVGGGPYRDRLEELAMQAPAGSVVFAGEVSEADLPRYYRLGHVFAMPCRNRAGGLEVEGLGLVFLEAAACARPVVVGDSGGARETLIDGVTGVLVEGRDVAAVADAVAGLLEEPLRADAMGAAGRTRVERRFTWDRASEQLAGWLREAADSRPQASPR
jgi:phosphatidyl-myo-inositol dimannoside synthase